MSQQEHLDQNGRVHRLSGRLHVLKTFVALAQRRVAMCNDVIAEVSELGILPRTVLLGQVLCLRETHAPSNAACDARLLQAALLIPGGFGVVIWENAVHFERAQESRPQESDAWRCFIPFEQCNQPFRQFVGAQYGDLVQQFVHLL